MRHSDSTELPVAVAEALAALPVSEKEALLQAWHFAGEADLSPPSSPARRAATWAVLEAQMAAPSALHRQRAERTRARPSAARSSLARPVYTLPAAAVVLLLVAAVLWLRPAPETFRAPADSARAITLTDGSRLKLEKGSTVQLGPDWPRTRTLLLAGNATFDVTRDPARPFAVITPEVNITVLGTRFSVAAGQHTHTRVRVEHGKVAVTHRQTSRQVVVEAQQQVVAQPGAEFVVQPLPSSPRAVFAFTDAPLSTLFAQIESLFGITVSYPAEVAARRLTITQHGPLDSAALLESICLPLDLTYRRTDTGFAVYPRGSGL